VDVHAVVVVVEGIGGREGGGIVNGGGWNGCVSWQSQHMTIAGYADSG
jgi:hypothetical protein